MLTRTKRHTANYMLKARLSGRMKHDAKHMHNFQVYKRKARKRLKLLSVISVAVIALASTFSR